MSGEVLPLAITMMAGPQILSAIIFVTGERPIATSAAFVSAVALGAGSGILIARGIAELLGGGVVLSEDSEPSTAALVIQLALVALLILLAVRTYLGRETADPPKWLGALQSAGPGRAFEVGALLITIFPSDLLVLLTVGFNLAGQDLGFTAALPLIGLTTLIAASPLLVYLLFRRRAETMMPRARDWMNTHSWLVNIGVYALFVVLILG